MINELVSIEALLLGSLIELNLFIAKFSIEITMFTRRLTSCSLKQIFKSDSLKHLINNSTSTKRSINTYQRLLARFYTDKHEWVEVNGNIGTIGISDYAQEALGDVVYAQLPEINLNLKQHDECGALESVKAASELYSPVSGSVKERNTAVEETPSLINTSCYEKGWLFRVELNNNEEIKGLMSEEQYKEFLKSSEH